MRACDGSVIADVPALVVVSQGQTDQSFANDLIDICAKKCARARVLAPLRDHDIFSCWLASHHTCFRTEDLHLTAPAVQSSDSAPIIGGTT